MIEVKGTVIMARLDYAEAKGGPGLLLKLQEAPPPVGPAATAVMLTLQIFPLSTDDAICRFIAEILKRDESIFMEIGAFSADQSRGLQKIVHGAKTDPQELLAGMPRQFPQYLRGDVGTARYEAAGSSGGRIIWKGHTQTYHSHCLSSIGYITRMLENNGVTGVTGRNAECLADGHSQCVWDFTWKEATGMRRSTQSFKAIKVKSR